MREALQAVFESKVGVYLILSAILMGLWYIVKHLDMLE
jgi:hypothetical protein